MIDREIENLLKLTPGNDPIEYMCTRNKLSYHMNRTVNRVTYNRIKNRLKELEKEFIGGGDMTWDGIEKLAYYDREAYIKILLNHNPQTIKDSRILYNKIIYEFSRTSDPKLHVEFSNKARELSKVLNVHVKTFISDINKERMGVSQDEIDQKMSSINDMHSKRLTSKINKELLEVITSSKPYGLSFEGNLPNGRIMVGDRHIGDLKDIKVSKVLGTLSRPVPPPEYIRVTAKFREGVLPSEIQENLHESMLLASNAIAREAVRGHDYELKPPEYIRAEVSFGGIKEKVVTGIKEDSMETKEKTYPITREGFKKIYDVACDNWKAKIVALSNHNIGPFESSGELRYNVVNEMFKAACNHNGVNQKRVLREVFPDYDEGMNIMVSGIQTVDNGYYLSWGDADFEKKTLLSMFNADINYFRMNQDGVKLTFTKNVCKQLYDYIEQNPD